jgi:hypothetical protein
MPKVTLVVENTFIDSSQSSNDLGLTVFKRVFNKLMSGEGPLGKVLPLYLEINGNYKIFGILTLNKSGSYSFFPELADGLPFDHITFVKDLSKDNHHYTKVTPSGREKVLPIHAEHLSNDMYHGISFACDSLMLKEAPKEIHYPEIDTEHLEEIHAAFLTSGRPEGSIIMKLGKNGCTVCLQFFLIPTKTDYRKMTIYPEMFRKYQKDFEIKEGQEINLFNAVVPHEYQSAYVLGIEAFLYDKKMDHPFLIAGAANRAGFYSKIDVAWQRPGRSKPKNAEN